MIIKDKEGRKYRLSKTRLTSSNSWGDGWYILFEDVRKHAGRSAQLWRGKCGPKHFVRVRIVKDRNSIGCREFGPRTFAKIMRATGAKKGKKS